MNKPSEEIKEKLDIVDIIQEYIQLKKAGANYKACCPFHNEKTPSFMVSQDKQIWHCFGCGKGGDIFAFVQEMEGVEFVDALRTLARKAGVQLKRQDPKVLSQRSKISEILDLTAEFFHQSLLRSKAGIIARKYLQERDIKDEALNEFKLGYAPDLWDALISFLNKKGYISKDVFDAGLIIKREKQDGYYDRFRNRIIFPIWDVQGNIIGFGGRVMPSDNSKEAAKYINSPQTQNYDKSKVLYGIDKAKTDIRKEDRVVVVEGYMDVISSHQAGVKNVVASSGTALTVEQINLLKRYTKNIVLAFDMDVAGDTAAKRGIDVALSQGMNVKVAQLPEDMDPDDYVKKDVEGWKKAIANASLVMDFYFNSAFRNTDIKNVEDKKKATALLLPIIAKISDDVEKAHYIQQLSEKISIEDSILFDYLKKISSDVSTSMYERPVLKIPDGGQKEGAKKALSMQLLSYLLNFPALISAKLKGINVEILHEDVQDIYKKLEKYYNSDSDNFDYSEFVAKTKKEDSKAAEDVAVVELYLHKDKVIKDMSLNEVDGEIDKTIIHLKEIYLKNLMQLLEQRIKKAEKADDSEELKKLSLEFNEVSKKLADLNL